MRNIPSVIARDFAGLWKTIGPKTAIRWLLCIVRRSGDCRRAGNLQPADRAMGPGPFSVRLRHASAQLFGEQVISGIREIWVRDVYLNDYLTIRDGDTVLDLGANMGNFTLLALGHGPRVRVVAVEADPAIAARWRANVGQSGWEARTTLVEAFVGGITPYQTRLASKRAQTVPTISADALLGDNGIDRIDFLKCDIEGSEFELLTPDSTILAVTRQLAIEVHKAAGDWQGFRRMIEAQGFETRMRSEDANGYILLGRRTGAIEPSRG